MAAQDESARNQLREYRIAVSEVVGELRSQEVRNTYAAITLPELIAQHRKMLSSTDPERIGRRERLTALKDNYLGKIEAMKRTDPDQYRTPDARQDSNT